MHYIDWNFEMAKIINRALSKVNSHTERDMNEVGTKKNRRIKLIWYTWNPILYRSLKWNYYYDVQRDSGMIHSCSHVYRHNFIFHSINWWKMNCWRKKKPFINKASSGSVRLVPKHLLLLLIHIIQLLYLKSAKLTNTKNRNRKKKKCAKQRRKKNHRLFEYVSSKLYSHFLNFCLHTSCIFFFFFRFRRLKNNYYSLRHSY